MNISVNLSVPKNLTRQEIKTKLIKLLPETYKIKSVKMPLKPGAGRRRGNAWELKFCKDLSLWWSNNKDDKIFKKAGSNHSVKDGHMFGDVYAVKPIGFPLTDKIAIELKVVKDSRVETANLLCGCSKMFNDFWEQTVRQAKLGGRHPVLVVKIDRYCILVFNLIDTIGKIKLGVDKVPLCILDDWFLLDTDKFLNII